MRRTAVLTILAGVIGFAGLAMGAGSRQYTVTVAGSGSLDSATVTIFVCSDSLCQLKTEIGTVSSGGPGTATASFSGPSTAKAFSYEVSEVDSGRESGYNSSSSPNPFGVPVSVGIDLRVTVSSGTTTSTTGSKK